MNQNNSKSDLKKFFIKLIAIVFAVIIVINMSYNFIFADKMESINKLFNLALKYKVRTIDTSPLYNKSEKIIGLLNRQRFKIISKIPKVSKNIKKKKYSKMAQ